MPTSDRCSTRRRCSSSPKRSRPGFDASCSSAASLACEAGTAGLQRRDVDRLHGTVAVERQAHELTGPGSYPPSPQVGAGRRTVASQPSSFVPSSTTSGLRGSAGGLLRLHRHNGLPLRRQDLSHAWTAACALSGSRSAHPRPPAPCHHRDRSKSQVTSRELMELSAIRRMWSSSATSTTAEPERKSSTISMV